MVDEIWQFVEKYYPNYSSSDDIAFADDLQKIIDGEIDPGSEAGRIWKEDYKWSMSEVLKDYNNLHKSIYERAIEGYINKQK